jgi:hypothetical protein
MPRAPAVPPVTRRARRPDAQTHHLLLLGRDGDTDEVHAWSRSYLHSDAEAARVELMLEGEIAIIAEAHMTRAQVAHRLRALADLLERPGVLLVDDECHELEQVTGLHRLSVRKVGAHG